MDNDEKVEDLEEVMLTTLDNPFNPFHQFDDWQAFDENKGYNSCSYLARVVKASDEFGEASLINSINKGIDEILSFNLLGNYCGITKSGKRINSAI